MSIDYPDLEPVQYQNAATALEALHSGQVDAALVGRKPYPHELSEGFISQQHKQGYTLITDDQQIISYSDLALTTIHCALSPEIAYALLPEGTNVIFHNDVEQSINSGLQSAVLIDWIQVMGEYQLLIPVDEQGNKIHDFRTPFLVYGETKIEEMKSFLHAIAKT